MISSLNAVLIFPPCHKLCWTVILKPSSIRFCLVSGFDSSSVTKKNVWISSSSSSSIPRGCHITYKLNCFPDKIKTCIDQKFTQSWSGSKQSSEETFWGNFQRKLSEETFWENFLRKLCKETFCEQIVDSEFLYKRLQPHLFQSPGSRKTDDSMIHELTGAKLDVNVSGYFVIFLSVLLTAMFFYADEIFQNHLVTTQIGVAPWRPVESVAG